MWLASRPSFKRCFTHMHIVMIIRVVCPPSLYREIFHRVDEKVPIVESFRENTRPPGVRTMYFVSLLPTRKPLDERCVALVPTFSSLQTTMCQLWNPVKNDFREKCDLKSVMLTTNLFVTPSFRCPSVCTATAMPRSVCPRPKFHCCQIASGNPHELSEIVPQLGSRAQQDWMLNCASVSSRISPDLPAIFFTLFARATVHLNCTCL